MTPTHREYRHEEFDPEVVPVTELEMGLLRNEAKEPAGLGLRWHYWIGAKPKPFISYIAEDLHPMADLHKVTPGEIIALIDASCASFNALLEDWFDLIGQPFYPAEYQLQEEAIHEVWRRASDSGGAGRGEGS
ncbi:MAG: hypothetical protein EOO16_16035 [Chitinophagaceae bacterium]|nr:MAG: hypothetical protein EOO16_16035 [Chitinophagaceae bacterium]